MQPWFEKYPQRLQRELQALQEAGFTPEVDPEAQEKGEIKVRVMVPVNGIPEPFIIEFPDLYPFFSFGVYAPTLTLAHHQDPYSKGLCLVADSQQQWRTSDTAAAYLQEQLPLVLEANENRETAAETEAHEATQVTGQIPAVIDSVVFTSDWVIPSHIERGYLLLGYERDPKMRRAGEPIRGAVLEVLDEQGNKLAELAPELRERFHGSFRGRWVRQAHPPKHTDARALEEAIAKWPAVAHPKFSGSDDVVGLLFPEELSYGEYHEAWLFVVRWKAGKTSRRRPGKGRSTVLQYLARSDQLSRQNLQLRVPRLNPLTDKTALFVGLGALGALGAWELARAGIGGINALDADHVQAGNLPRWLLGAPAVGFPKARIIAEYLGTHYPFLKAKWFHHRLGRAGDNQVLEAALDGVDIIIDMSAEWTVNHALSSIARERNIPYVWATATPGGWGGIIGRVVPERTPGCWGCFQARLSDGEGGGWALPAQEEEEAIQGIGCFQPTFTGAGFDLDQISTNAVRLAVSTLCAGQPDAYPDFSWDIGILNLWDTTAGIPIAPHWTTSPLIIHPHCPVHGEH